MVGQTVLHYTILSELGAGGMGRVYLARDTRTDRRVALKFLAHEDDPAQAGRLEREAQAAARLSHPGIVALHALEEAGGQRFLVEEYVEGETLQARLERGRLGPAELRRLARELAAALAHAHRHGVLHRDLKPDNVLLAADGAYKIADFGIARVQGAPALTVTGDVPGTLAYLAPERLRGAAGDARADLFALGAILYEAMTGRRAFEGSTAAEVTYALLHVEPALPADEALRPLAALTARLLAKEPSQRPPSAEALEAMLEVAAGTPAAAPRRPRRLRPWVAAAIVLLALGAAAGWWLARQAARPSGASVAVLTFENVASPEDAGREGAIAGNLLVTSIAQAPELEVLSPQRVLEARRELGERAGDRGLALELARRVRASRIVTGSILQLAPRVVLTAEVSDVRSGRVLGAVRVEGTAGQTLYEVVDALALRVLQKLAPAAPALAPVAERTSPVLEAQRHFAEGQERLAATDLAAAEAAFGRAIALDSTFAQAYYERALAAWWRTEAPIAASDVERAMALSSRLSRYERSVIEGVHALVFQRHADARRIFEDLVRRHPQDVLAGYGLVEAAFHSADHATAETQARRVLARHPRFFLAGAHLVDALAALGREAAADSAALALLAREPRNVYVRRSIFALRGRQGDLAGALAVAREARGLGLGDAFRIQAAMLLVWADSLDAARQWLADDESLPGRPESEALEYWLALRGGRFRRALQRARAAWAQVPPDPSSPRIDIPLATGFAAAAGGRELGQGIAWAESAAVRLERARWPNARLIGELEIVQLLLSARRVDDARRRMAALETRPEARTSQVRPMLDFGRGMLLTAQGRGREALAALKGAHYFSDPVYTTGAPRLARARALAAAGDAGAAAAAYDTLLGAPIVSPDEAARALLERARQREKLGRHRDAQADARRFLALWAQADRGLPEIAEARGLLARVERRTR